MACKLRAMRRSACLLFLLLSLLWQSVATAGGRLLPELAEDAEHAALHWQDQAHHHHDDGSYETHDAGDGGTDAHVHFDGAAGGAALPVASPRDPGSVAAGVPAFFYLLTLPSPPGGRRRPPRTAA
jgi:hypothetical protein